MVSSIRSRWARKSAPNYSWRAQSAKQERGRSAGFGRRFATGSQWQGVSGPGRDFMNGKFWDASAYKADPVPMALEPGNVYEVEQTGSSLGLFTVNSALHSNAQNTAEAMARNRQVAFRRGPKSRATPKAESAGGNGQCGPAPAAYTESVKGDAWRLPRRSRPPTRHRRQPPASSGDEPPRLTKEHSASAFGSAEGIDAVGSSSAGRNQTTAGDSKPPTIKPIGRGARVRQRGDGCEPSDAAARQACGIRCLTMTFPVIASRARWRRHRARRQRTATRLLELRPTRVPCS